MVVLCVSSEHVSGVALRDGLPEDDVTLDVAIVQFHIDLIEVVAEKDCMLFVITISKI